MPKMRIILFALALVFSLGISSSFAASFPNGNFGSIMQGLHFSDLQTASGAFFKAGTVIIICSMVVGIRNADSTMNVLLAIVTPLALAWAMTGCLSGTGSSPQGWCFFMSKIANGMAKEVNPKIFTGNEFDVMKLFAPGGAGNPTLGDIWNSLSLDMFKTEDSVTQNPSSSTGSTPTATAELSFGSIMGGIANIGKAILGVLLGIVYFFLLLIIEFVCFILIAFSAIVIQLMLMLQQFLLTLSSVFLPLFIAALSVKNLRGIGMSYILSCVSIACWPIGWAAGHVGTVALFQMAFNNLNVLLNNPTNITDIMAAAIILIILPFWIIVVTLVAPYAMGKMLTTGSNFASAIALTAGQMAVKTVGTTAMGWVIFPGAGEAILSGGKSVVSDGDGESGGKSEGEEGKTSGAGVGTGKGGKEGGVEAGSTGGLGEFMPKATSGPIMEDGSTADSIEEAASEAGFDLSGDDTSDEQDAGVKEPTDSEDGIHVEPEDSDDGITKESSEVAVAEAGESAMNSPETAKKSADKKGAIRKGLSGFGKLMVSASKFDGSGESLVSSGLLDFPEKKELSKEAELMTEIRDELKQKNSSLQAMKEAGIEPQPMAEDPEAEAAKEEETGANLGEMGKGALRSFGKLLVKASKFNGSGESLVASGLFDFPEKEKESKEAALMTEIRDTLRSQRSSMSAMKDSGVDPDIVAQPDIEPESNNENNPNPSAEESRPASLVTFRGNLILRNPVDDDDLNTDVAQPKRSSEAKMLKEIRNSVKSNSSSAQALKDITPA